MVIFTSAREAPLAAQWNPVLWPGTDERFTGYGVMGLPFRSGHCLAIRHMPALSIGPEHQTVWHRAARYVDLAGAHTRRRIDVDVRHRPPTEIKHLAQQDLSACDWRGSSLHVAGRTRRPGRHRSQRSEVHLGARVDLGVWRSRAMLRGVDLGALHPLPRQLRLADFWLPQRGLYPVGNSAFENFDPARHALPSAFDAKSVGHQFNP